MTVSSVFTADPSNAGQRSAVSHLSTGILWAVCLAGSGYLADRSYVRERQEARAAGDFSIYFDAAKQVAAQHSPYLAKDYVYPPLIAAVLSPLAHGAYAPALRLWTILSIVAVGLVACCLVVVEAKRLESWMLPLLFLGCTATTYEFFPFKDILQWGQADTFVLAGLAVAMVGIERQQRFTAGALVGFVGVLKAWPAAIVLYFFRRRNVRRRSDVLAFAVVLAIAPVLALAMGGVSELRAMLASAFDARSQSYNVSDSVWGIPRMLFSRSGLARQLVVSPGLRGAATAVLLTWVVLLLVAVLRRPEEGSLPLWEVAGCVVLLLPVSHEAYSVLWLPILWLWAVRVARERGRELTSWVVLVLLAVWWLVMHRAWPGDDWPASISSLRFSVLFFANLAALTVSIAGSRWLGRARIGEPTVEESEVRLA